MLSSQSVELINSISSFRILDKLISFVMHICRIRKNWICLPIFSMKQKIQRLRGVVRASLVSIMPVSWLLWISLLRISVRILESMEIVHQGQQRNIFIIKDKELCSRKMSIYCFRVQSVELFQNKSTMALKN